MSHMDDEIIDIRSKSLRDNILIHNYAFTPDLAVSMPHDRFSIMEDLICEVSKKLQIVRSC